MSRTIKQLREAVRRDRKDANAANLLGEALGRRSEHASAERYFRRAVKLQPHNVRYLDNLAGVLTTLGKMPEAEIVYQRALRLKPHAPSLNAALGQLYFEFLNDIAKARKHYHQAVLSAPDDLNSYRGLCSCYIQDDKFRQGLACAERILGANDKRLKLLQGFALALMWEGRYDEVRDCCRQILQLNPADEIGLFGFVQAAMDQQDSATALHYHQEALRLRPDSLYTILPYLRYLLRLGDYDAARRYYRGLADRLIHGIKYDAPQWDGSSLSGKTILLDCRWGYGDAIQFARFAAPLKQQGAKVLFQSHQPICSLLETIDEVDQAIALHDECSGYDYIGNANLIWLLTDAKPEALGQSVPYLKPSSRARRKWGAKIETQELKVGLCWQSTHSLLHANPYSAKSIPFDRIRQLADVAGVTYYSLQKGFLADQSNPATLDFPMIDFTGEIHDFMDTAAITAALDLVITVDTSVAHLAGALGIPTFLLLPYSAWWTWLLNRTDTPWYPTMRLFRQQTPGDWAQVLSQVKQVLQETVIGRNYLRESQCGYTLRR